MTFRVYAKLAAALLLFLFRLPVAEASQDTGSWAHLIALAGDDQRYAVFAYQGLDGRGMICEYESCEYFVVDTTGRGLPSPRSPQARAHPRGHQRRALARTVPRRAAADVAPSVERANPG